MSAFKSTFEHSFQALQRKLPRSCCVQQTRISACVVQNTASARRLTMFRICAWNTLSKTKWLSSIWYRRHFFCKRSFSLEGLELKGSYHFEWKFTPLRDSQANIPETSKTQQTSSTYSGRTHSKMNSQMQASTLGDKHTPQNHATQEFSSCMHSPNKQRLVQERKIQAFHPKSVHIFSIFHNQPSVSIVIEVVVVVRRRCRFRCDSTSIERKVDAIFG